MNAPEMYPQAASYPQATYTKSPSPSALLEFDGEIQSAVKQVRQLREQAAIIADGVFGIVPTITASGLGVLGGTSFQGLSVASNTAPPPAKAALVRNGIADLHSAITALRTEIERLSCI